MSSRQEPRMRDASEAEGVAFAVVGFYRQARAWLSDSVVAEEQRRRGWDCNRAGRCTKREDNGRDVNDERDEAGLPKQAEHVATSRSRVRDPECETLGDLLAAFIPVFTSHHYHVRCLLYSLLPHILSPLCHRRPRRCTSCAGCRPPPPPFTPYLLSPHHAALPSLTSPAASDIAHQRLCDTLSQGAFQAAGHQEGCTHRLCHQYQRRRPSRCPHRTPTLRTRR